MSSLKHMKTPPVRQIGDPCLRQVSAPVGQAYLEIKEFQAFLELMVHTMRMKNGSGICAPQLGVNLQAIAVEFTGHDLKKAMDVYGGKGVREMEMVLHPLQVIFNPAIMVPNPNEKATFREGCLSVEGYTAMVPRYKEIIVTGVSREGKPVQFEARGWVARIYQHELDHLNGTMYVDSMDPKTFTNERWREHKVPGQGLDS